MMPHARKRRFTSATRSALLGVLLLASTIGLVSRPGVIAQEIQATPLTDEGAASFAAASSALSLTINSGPVNFGQLWTGETTQIESAAVVRIGETAGSPWQLSCSVEPTAAHTTDLPVTALEYMQASASSDWIPFQTSMVPCTGTISGDATVRFTYRIQVPLAASPGTFEAVVTYSVSAIE